jgi:hypothetical protein
MYHPKDSSKNHHSTCTILKWSNTCIFLDFNCSMFYQNKISQVWKTTKQHSFYLIFSSFSASVSLSFYQFCIYHFSFVYLRTFIVPTARLFAHIIYRLHWLRKWSAPPSCFIAQQCVTKIVHTHTRVDSHCVSLSFGFNRKM